MLTWNSAWSKASLKTLKFLGLLHIFRKRCPKTAMGSPMISRQASSPRLKVRATSDEVGSENNHVAVYVRGMENGMRASVSFKFSIVFFE